MNCVDYVQRCSLCGSGDEKFTRKSQNMLRADKRLFVFTGQHECLLGAGKNLK